MKKMVFGGLLALIGTVFTSICFIYAINNQYVSYNGSTGLWTAFAGNHIVIPTVVSVAMLIAGLVICGYECYRKSK